MIEHRKGNNAVEQVNLQPEKQLNTAEAKKERKRREAELRKQLQPLSNKIKRAERVLEKLGLQKDDIESQLADTKIYNDESKERLKTLLTDQAYLQKELDQAETDWLDASQAHESMLSEIESPN